MFVVDVQKTTPGFGGSLGGQDSAFSHTLGYDSLQQKHTKQNQPRGKACWAKSRETRCKHPSAFSQWSLMGCT